MASAVLVLLPVCITISCFSCLEFVSRQDISHHFNSPVNWNYTNGNIQFPASFQWEFQLTDMRHGERNETNETIVISNLDKLWDPPQFAYFRHMWWVVRQRHRLASGGARARANTIRGGISSEAWSYDSDKLRPETPWSLENYPHWQLKSCRNTSHYTVSRKFHKF